MKKILALVLVALMILSMAACSSKAPANDTTKTDTPATDNAPADTPSTDDAAQPAEEAKAWVGGYACHSANDFFDAIEMGLEEGAASSNGTILRADSELSTAGELAIIENFIAQSVDVIFLTPDDPSGSIEGVKLANEAGIPVVVISSELAEGDYEVLCTIKSDDYTAASGAAEYAMQQIGGTGNVLILNGMQTSDVIDRINGYKDTIAKYPDVTIANEVMVTENSVAACTTAIENMLQAWTRRLSSASTASASPPATPPWKTSASTPTLSASSTSTACRLRPTCSRAATWHSPAPMARTLRNLAAVPLRSS